MAPEYFATLTPANPRAKAAFSAVVEESLLRGQDSSPDPLDLTVSVRAEPVFDKEVLLYRRQAALARSRSSQHLSDDSTTDMETDVEGEPKDRGVSRFHIGYARVRPHERQTSLGLYLLSLGGIFIDFRADFHARKKLVWSGHYLFSFDSIEPGSQVGWQAGKGSQNNLRLASPSFAKQHDPSLRSIHVRFNFDTSNRAFFLARGSRRSDVEVAVNGESITLADVKHYLNQHQMKIKISSMDYVFQYSAFAQTVDYQKRLQDYLRDLGPIFGLLQHDIPTPLPDTRTIQKWTLNKALGKGGSGRVSLATDKSGHVAAIKVVTKDTKTAHAVDEEVRILEILRRTDGSEEDKARMVRLEEVISLHTAVDKANPFVEVALVMTPAMSSTLDSIIQKTQNRYYACQENERGGRCMLPENAKFFCEALRGLRFLHSKGWMHGDMKPQNIGIAHNPLRAVLLDLGSAREVHGAAGSTQLRPGGTIPYLSPEREMYDCGKPADIWAMGVVGFQLTRGSLPWQFSRNPWRHGEDSTDLQSAFKEKYKESLALLKSEDLIAGRQDIDSETPLFLASTVITHPLEAPRDDAQMYHCISCRAMVPIHCLVYFPRYYYRDASLSS